MKNLALLMVFATCSFSALASSQYSQCTLRIEDNDTRIDLLENSHVTVKFNLEKGKTAGEEINLKRVIMFEKDTNKNDEIVLEKTDDLIVMFDTLQTKQLIGKVTTEYDEDLIGKSLKLKNNLTIEAKRTKDRKVEIKIKSSGARSTYTVRLTGIGAEVHGSFKVPFTYTGTKGILWAKKDTTKYKSQKIKFSCRITDAPSDGLDELDTNSHDSEDVRAEKRLLKEASSGGFEQ